MKTLRDIGEDSLIDSLVALVPQDPNPAAGPGDDCAVIDRDPHSPNLLLLKTDALVEHIHFLPDTPPRAVGWKAAARVVSDFAAMGGRPEYFLVTLALSPETAVAWAEDLYRGIGDCLGKFGGVLAGGETSSARRVPPPSFPSPPPAASAARTSSSAPPRNPATPSSSPADSAARSTANTSISLRASKKQTGWYPITSQRP